MFFFLPFLPSARQTRAKGRFHGVHGVSIKPHEGGCVEVEGIVLRYKVHGCFLSLISLPPRPSARTSAFMLRCSRLISPTSHATPITKKVVFFASFNFFFFLNTIASSLFYRIDVQYVHSYSTCMEKYPLFFLFATSFSVLLFPFFTPHVRGEAER